MRPWAPAEVKGQPPKSSPLSSKRNPTEKKNLARIWRRAPEFLLLWLCQLLWKPNRELEVGLLCLLPMTPPASAGHGCSLDADQQLLARVWILPLAVDAPLRGHTPTEAPPRLAHVQEDVQTLLAGER